jgi:hypothetical protein
MSPRVATSVRTACRAWLTPSVSGSAPRPPADIGRRRRNGAAPVRRPSSPSSSMSGALAACSIGLRRPAPDAGHRTMVVTTRPPHPVWSAAIRVDHVDDGEIGDPGARVRQGEARLFGPVVEHLALGPVARHLLGRQRAAIDIAERLQIIGQDQARVRRSHGPRSPRPRTQRRCRAPGFSHRSVRMSGSSRTGVSSPKRSASVRPPASP